MLLKLEPTLGFTMKVVEKTGANLRSKFPLYNLLEGAICGRGDCIPCTQEAEFLQPCTTTSVVYENICRECNPGAGGKRELESVETTIPTAYVGETSKSVKERIGEHWSSYRSIGSESHLYKHQELHHGGAPPSFVVRVIHKAKSALERQTREAIRIQRRGGEGAILNSKAEFSRCYIPRLQLEEQDKIKEMEQEEKKQDDELARELEAQQKQWETEKTRGRGTEQKKISRELGEIEITSQIK